MGPAEQERNVQHHTERQVNREINRREFMTVNIDYEADKKLDFDYEKIIREVINGALDFEECPYETEVNVVLTTNDEIAMINRDTEIYLNRRMYCHFR